ncbi:MAG: dihydroorotase [Bacteroidetes bacterium]|nr:dihydroorotase [Bacteroidota bacterium]
MKRILINNAFIVNEGKIFKGNILIEGELISKVSESPINVPVDILIDGADHYLFPGCIDDQVHFREPGLTHKGEIYSEAKAAVAGGVTSYMEMPNTVPNVFTQELLEEKYKRASEVSLANYSFFMGASNDNLEEVLKTDPKKVCGIKVFMGSSTGNMLVDKKETLEGLFSKCKMLIATHSEDEETIKKNIQIYKDKYGENIPIESHPLIRSEEACYKSSLLAVSLAKKYNTRLHILHISTEKELELFDNKVPLKEKRITAEACIHHLWFSDEDYKTKGNYIKWNPAIKKKSDRDAILKGVLENKIDIIATDHAPHTIEEKEQSYSKAPSGGPLIQHSLVAMIELHKQGKISLEKIAEKMAHAVADCFQIEKRGYIREGYFADLVLVDMNSSFVVDRSNVLYKCGWSPFDGQTFHSQVKYTFVNGNLVYENGFFNEENKGERLTFVR